MISLKDITKFHGHLGPYAVLGVLMGEYALKKLKAKKYFGIEVKVWGANKKPRYCLVDGLQLSTGATYGKNNIHKLNGFKIKVKFYNRLNGYSIVLGLRKSLIKKLQQAKTHRGAERLAREIYKTDLLNLFEQIINN